MNLSFSINGWKLGFDRIIEVLAENKIKGAALDVFECEEYLCQNWKKCNKNIELKIIENDNVEMIYNKMLMDKCDYIILKKKMTDEKNIFDKYGFELICENELYVLYKINIIDDVKIKK